MFPEASNRISGTANRARQDSDLEVCELFMTGFCGNHDFYESSTCHLHDQGI